MQATESDNTGTGKIQYLQANQGFIRCRHKIFGKRDIIFFFSDSPMFEGKLKLGTLVKFNVVENGHRENCKGGQVTHWAVITSICEGIERDANTSQGSCKTSSDLSDSSSLYSMGSLEESYGYDVNRTNFKKCELPERDILHDLMQSVYLSLYHVVLDSSIRQNTIEGKSCWDV